LEEVTVTKIDPYIAAFDDPAAVARRADADADNRRDNWQRQMELAQIGQMAGGVTAPAVQPTGLHAHWAPLAGAATASPAATSTGRDTSHATQDAAKDRAADDGPASARQGAGAHEDADGASRALDEDDGAAAADAGTLPGRLAPLTAGGAAPLAAAPPPAMAQPAALSGAGSAAVALAAAALSGAGSAAVVPAAAAQAPAPLSGVPPFASAAALHAVLPPPASAQGEAPEPPAAGRPGADAAQPDWQKRMLHLTGQADDVAVWIRDQDLTPAQSQLLLARVAADVAGMGLRLKGATINGKPVLRAGVPEQDQRAGLGDDGPPLIHPTTEQQHVSR
jgi:hypothetical protein